MNDEDDTSANAGGEPYDPYLVAVSLIARRMKLSQPDAERAVQQLGQGGHVRVRGGIYRDTRFIGGPESRQIPQTKSYRIWQHASYSRPDLERVIRAAEIPEASGSQQPAASEAQPQSRKGVGGAPRKFDWDALAGR
jgi:hypothetical protein